MYAIIEKLEHMERTLSSPLYRGSMEERVDKHKRTLIVRKGIGGQYLHFSVASDGSTTLQNILKMYNLNGYFVLGGKKLNAELPIREAAEGHEDGPDLRSVTIGAIFYIGEI